MIDSSGKGISIGVPSKERRQSKEESSFSEEKEAKRLLFLRLHGAPIVGAAEEQKYFGSFLQKRTAFFQTLLLGH
jgi:hypothetical protein